MGRQWQTLFFFLGSQVTADGDCSHEIKRHLLLGRKLMTNLDSILKSRYITLPTKVCLLKAVGFPVVMYGCESWTIKTAEPRIDAFEPWCWRRLLRGPSTARRFNQFIIKEISPGCSLEGQCWSSNSSTLATWCKELTQLKRPWYWERSRAGGGGATKNEVVGWDHWLYGHGFGWTLGFGSGQGGLDLSGSWGCKESDMTERLNWYIYLFPFEPSSHPQSPSDTPRSSQRRELSSVCNITASH